MNKESFYIFSEPERVDQNRLMDYLGVFAEACGEYYLPPISFAGLGHMRSASPQHGSCLVFRRNMLVRAYRSGALSKGDLRCSAMDFLTFGNAFFEIRRNGVGGVTGLSYVPTINMRVLTDGKGYRQLLKDGNHVDFSQSEMLCLREHDPIQQIYGMPDWLGGMQSVLLNEDATLFRRKYFKNGCHLGYIFYTNDAKMTPEQEESIKTKLQEGTGAGNFRTMFVSIPNGSEKAIQIIPIGDISQRDEFTAIKNLSAADVREAHRVPPILMGVVPEGSGSLGDPIKVEQVYTQTEVAAMVQTYEELNDYLPRHLQLKFELEKDNAE